MSLTLPSPMEVITAHLPMRDRVLAGLQSSAAGTRPRPQPALRRPGPLRYRKAARLAPKAPPTHRGHGGPPRCHLPAPTHRVGPIMHPMPWLRAMCIHHGQMDASGASIMGGISLFHFNFLNFAFKIPPSSDGGSFSVTCK
jgi:hypothetical protein